jgi:hypothetical protein
MRKILLAFSIFFTKTLLGQYELDPQLNNQTVLIDIKKFGSGSGIYLQDSGNIYFVTAAHVIADVKNNNIPCDTTFLISYRLNTEADKADTLVLFLCEAFKNGYGQIDTKNDVAIIKIGTQQKIDSLYFSIKYLSHVVRKGPSTRINSWPISQVKKFNDVKLGNDIFIFGYPKSLNLQFTFDFNRPLLRKGNIAGRDLKLKRIIADCPSYQGNSGGPVYSFFLDDQNLFLVGVVSAFIPLEEYWYNDKYPVRNIQISNSGYSVIIPIELALDLIPKLK